MARDRTIVVVTGSRAEFGLLEPVMRAIQAARSARGRKGVSLRLETVVAGSHLTTGSWRDVRSTGFTIDAKVAMQKATEVGRQADVAALGRGISGFGKVFGKLKPAVVLVLGDRIEALAAACAASVGGLCLAHIHGGDRAAGVADEAMRHAISKLAHLHFVATANSRKRLIRMGEPLAQVFLAGSPAVDGLRMVKPAANAREVVVIQHPIGASDRDECEWMQQTLQATDGMSRLVMAPNHDPGSRGIRRALRLAKVSVVEHMPRSEFLAQLAGAKAVVGNSSAGLIEAAVLGCACVNIGPRQAGRETPSNVVECKYGLRPVKAALKKALSLDLRRGRHPYGDGQAGERIAAWLASVDLESVPIRKQNSY